MQHTDPLTGETFIPHRTNQRFASRKNQVRFNNMNAAKKRKSKAQFDRILDKNRNILKAVLGNKKETSLSKEYLLGAGFHFGYLTHNVKNGDTIYNCIYDYCYTRLDKDRYKIIQNATNN